MRHYFDVRTGLNVDCLPPMREPWRCVINGYVLVSASLRANIEAKRDREEWLSIPVEARDYV